MNRILTLLLAASCLTAVGQVPDYVPTDGLVGWWGFDGDALDQSGNENHGVTYGVEFSHDRFGNANMAATFGMNRWIQIGHSPSIDFVSGDSLTWAIWMKTQPTTAPYGQVIFQKWNGSLGTSYPLSVGCGNQGNLLGSASFCHSDQSLGHDVSTSIGTDTWLHGLMTQTPDSAFLYVNGVLVSASAIAEVGCGNAEPLNIGKKLGSIPAFYEGELDDFGLWNRTLSEAEILGLYNTEVQTLGCTDSLACNYDSGADGDDGSCVYFSIDVPVICDALSVLECSAFLDWGNGFAAEQVEGYNFIGTFGESHYYVSEESFYAPHEWYEQDSFAQALGGHLADIQSEEENQFLSAGIYQAGLPEEGAWLGLSDYDSEGSWSWTSGAPLTFTAWREGQPDNYTAAGEHWGHIYSNEATWNDLPETVALPCIIELPLQPLWSLQWNNGTSALTTTYLISEDTIEATLFINGTEECIASQAVTLGQGCNDPLACNFIEGDTCNVSCLYVLNGVDCESVNSSFCGEGTVWDVASQTCIVANPADINFDGCVQLNDLLDLLSAYGDCAAEESAWLCGDPLEYQGYDYETVQIGEQCWFAENLRAENYRNGDAIPANLSDGEWSSTSTGAVAVYGEGLSDCNGFNPDGNACDEYWSLNEYGRLYNWFAVDDARGLCPHAWSVPADGDWMELELILGLDSTLLYSAGYRGDSAGIQLRDDVGWFEGGNGNDAVGYSARPAGYRYAPSGTFSQAGKYAQIWTSSTITEEGAIARLLSFEEVGVKRSSLGRTRGISVRCVKDAE